MEMMILVMAALSGLFLLGAYRRGVCDGMRIAKGKSIEVVRGKAKGINNTPYDKHTEAVLTNIERYNGTASGQQIIER